MRTLNTNDGNFTHLLAKLRAELLPEKLLFEQDDKFLVVKDIIAQVRRDGDKALCELTARFDETEIKPDKLRVEKPLMKTAAETLSCELRKAIEESITNVQRYQRHIKAFQTLGICRDDIELKTRYLPLDRIGIYIPAGSAPLFSTLIMTAVPAQVAGVKNIAVTSAPRYGGDIDPVILGTCSILGIDEVYRVGGAQAIAAMACGTETVPKVDKIVGPGNTYVQLAKKAVFGMVGIESFAGQSEIVVLADEDANPRYVAADLICQAEHAPGSAMLVTPSAELAAAVPNEVDSLLKRSDRADQTRQCLDESSAIIVTNTLDEAIDIVNQLAPEHVSVQTQNADVDAEACTNAGAIFVGAYTSEALGDYIAGPSHVLPTGGSARFFSPLNVMDFMRHTSVIKYGRNALNSAYPALKAMTEAESLPGHLLSATVRIESNGE